MKKSKIISKLIRFLSVRPVFFVVAGIVLIDAIYVNYFFVGPGLKKYEAGQSVKATVEGKVRDKAYDENGMVKSITVGNVLCYVNHSAGAESVPSLGSVVRVSGSIGEIEGPMNPGEFNRKSYYTAKRIFYEVSAESVEIVRSRQEGIKERFLELRRKCSQRIMDYFPLEGGTVSTLISADKTYLSKDRKALYSGVGVGHFLVISGLHISAVGTLIYKGLRRMGLKTRTGCVASMAVLILYGCLIGFSVSVIRALIMFFVRLMADVLKRVYDMLNAVAVAALFNIVINPLCVLDSGFVYSYATVLSIAVYITYITEAGKKPAGLIAGLKEIFRFPAALWLFIMPVNLYLSYSVSLLAVCANTLLVPICVPVLVLAFVGFFLSFTGLSVPTGIMDFLIAVMLRSFDKLCKLLSTSSFFTLSGRPAVWKIVLYYVCLLWIMCVGKKRMGKVLWVGVLAGLVLFTAIPRNLTGRVATLYVGQGECVVVHTGYRSAAVYDCGSTSKNGVGEYILIPYLKAMGVGRVDAVFVSHGDLDHVGEVASLCEKLPRAGIAFKRLYVQDIPSKAKSKALLEAERAAASANIPVIKLSRGMKTTEGAVSFTCLWPKKGSVPQDANEGSMVIMASVKGFDALLMGDATSETEGKIAADVSKVAAGTVEMLLVSHHGSVSASNPVFLRTVNPRTAVVSAGLNNRYGHPHKEVLERFTTLIPRTRLYRTDQSGAITEEMRGKKLKISIHSK